MAQKDTSMARQEEQRRARTPSLRTEDPFRMMQRLSDEMTRMFGTMGFGGRSPFAPAWRTEGSLMWAPEIDAFQRGNELVIKADLPGMKKDDVTVDITEDAVTIQGERRSDVEDEREGVYRAERSYGSFCRVIPLPQGTITDQAKATFRDGVLEVTMPAPPEQVRRGRRIELAEETEQKP